MIVIETEKDSSGFWAYTVSAGDKGDLDEYAVSDFDFETSEEAEIVALQWIVDEWHVL